MAKHYGALFAISSLALALAACGGGSNNNNDVPTTPPVTNPPVDPSQPNLAERIEPFDPSAKLASNTSMAATASAVRAAALPQNVRSVVLAAPEAGSTLKVSAAQPEPGTPLQIGLSRAISKTASVVDMGALLSWQTGAAGTQVAAVSFESTNAKGVRLGVLVNALPDGSLLRFYSASAREAAVQVSAQELREQSALIAHSGASDSVAKTYWSPEFGGSTTVLEIQIPAGADSSQVQISVPKLSHFAQSMEDATLKIGAASCNIDAMCQPDYLNQSRSTARMQYVKEDGTGYYCTGTLLNDAKSSSTPYFVTANHCINTQAQATSLATDWFYRSASCNSSATDPGLVHLTGGATLLYATADTDTSFLQLNKPAPAGVVYAGSYFGNPMVKGNVVSDVHQPQGDKQKLSVGTVQGYSKCTQSGSCSVVSQTSDSFYSVTWQQGTTEQGSSGSGLMYTIAGKRYVVGTLFGGVASCAAPNASDYFGRFDVPYKAKIKQWLNP